MTGFIQIPINFQGLTWINIDHILFVNKLFDTLTIILLTGEVRLETGMAVEDIMDQIEEEVSASRKK